jgi:hypothetical protein
VNSQALEASPFEKGLKQGFVEAQHLRAVLGPVWKQVDLRAGS